MRLLQIPGTKPGRRLLAAAGVLLLALGGCATPQQEAEDEKEPELVWPLPPDPARIKFVRVFRARGDVEQEGPDVASLLLGEAPMSGERIKKPYSVYADKDGRLFVADTGWGKVLVFDAENKKFDVWGTRGKGMLSKPAGITSDSRGRYYVTDTIQKRVVIYNADGEFVSALGRKGELERPSGIALNEALGRVYVVDTKKHHIAVFDMMEGTLVSTIGVRGSEAGQFNFPTGLAIGRNGDLHVMDTMNFRVQILGPDGQFRKAFGEIGDSLGQFSRPKGITVDSDGNIYVSDAAFSNFQIFDPDGQLLLFVGELGQKPGQFWLPAGVYMGEDDRLYVADQYNFRVQVFERVKQQDAEEASTATPAAVTE